MPMHTCTACTRHVKADEAVCPFCQSPSDTGRNVGLGAAIVTSAVLAACMAPPTVSPVYGAPAPPMSPSPGTSASPQLPPQGQ